MFVIWYYVCSSTDINQYVKIYDLKTTNPETQAKYMNGAVAILNSLSSTVIETVTGEYEPERVSVCEKLYMYLDYIYKYIIKI